VYIKVNEVFLKVNKVFLKVNKVWNIFIYLLKS